MVKLIYASPLWLISNGIRYSRDNHNLSDSKILFRDNGGIETTIGTKDFNLIKKVGFKLKHQSVLEHSLLVFDIECSRAVLQELARHRHISLTVKSTRYTLKELKNEKPFSIFLKNDYTDESIDSSVKRASKYIMLTYDKDIDNMSIKALENLRYLLNLNKSNDIAKYALPESFKTKIQLSVNLRELVHILKLRINKDALWEFRQLSKEIINVLPEDYKELVLLEPTIKENYERMK